MAASNGWTVTASDDSYTCFYGIQNITKFLQGVGDISMSGRGCATYTVVVLLARPQFIEAG